MNRKSYSAEASGYALGLLIGTVLGASAIIVLVAALGASYSGSFVLNFQTLIGAIIALLGALGGVWAILLQIRHSQALADEQRENRKSAARTLLPSALTALSGYASDCVGLLKAIRGSTTGELFDPIPLSDALTVHPLPAHPREAILDLRECVEWAPAEVQDAILRLVAKLQIQSSRLASVHQTLSGRPSFLWRTISKQDLDEKIVDGLEVHALCSRLFDYARKRSETVDRAVEVRSAASNNDIQESDFPNVYALIDATSE